MIKELTLKEVARKLADEGPFEGFVRDYSSSWNKEKIIGVYFSDIDYPIVTKKENWLHCAIEIPDPKPVYEPYPDDECPPLKCGDVIVFKENGIECLITEVDKRKIDKAHIYCFCWKKNKELFEDLTMLDGSPIGRKKE